MQTTVSSNEETNFFGRASSTNPNSPAANKIVALVT